MFEKVQAPEVKTEIDFDLQVEELESRVAFEAMILVEGGQGIEPNYWF